MDRLYVEGEPDYRGFINWTEADVPTLNKPLQGAHLAAIQSQMTKVLERTISAEEAIGLYDTILYGYAISHQIKDVPMLRRHWIAQRVSVKDFVLPSADAITAIESCKERCPPNIYRANQVMYTACHSRFTLNPIPLESPIQYPEPDDPRESISQGKVVYWMMDLRTFKCCYKCRWTCQVQIGADDWFDYEVEESRVFLRFTENRQVLKGDLDNIGWKETEISKFKRGHILKTRYGLMRVVIGPRNSFARNDRGYWCIPCDETGRRLADSWFDFKFVPYEMISPKTDEAVSMLASDPLSDADPRTEITASKMPPPATQQYKEAVVRNITRKALLESRMKSATTLVVSQTKPEQTEEDVPDGPPSEDTISETMAAVISATNAKSPLMKTKPAKPRSNRKRKDEQNLEPNMTHLMSDFSPSGVSTATSSLAVKPAKKIVRQRVIPKPNVVGILESVSAIARRTGPAAGGVELAKALELVVDAIKKVSADIQNECNENKQRNFVLLQAVEHMIGDLKKEFFAAIHRASAKPAIISEDQMQKIRVCIMEKCAEMMTEQAFDMLKQRELAKRFYRELNRMPAGWRDVLQKMQHADLQTYREMLPDERAWTGATKPSFSEIVPAVGMLDPDHYGPFNMDNTANLNQALPPPEEETAARSTTSEAVAGQQLNTNLKDSIIQQILKYNAGASVEVLKKHNLQELNEFLYAMRGEEGPELEQAETETSRSSRTVRRLDYAPQLRRSSSSSSRETGSDDDHDLYDTRHPHHHKKRTYGSMLKRKYRGPQSNVGSTATSTRPTQEIQAEAQSTSNIPNIETSQTVTEGEQTEEHPQFHVEPTSANRAVSPVLEPQVQQVVPSPDKTEEDIEALLEEAVMKKSEVVAKVQDLCSNDGSPAEIDAKMREMESLDEKINRFTIVLAEIKAQKAANEAKTVTTARITKRDLESTLKQWTEHASYQTVQPQHTNLPKQSPSLKYRYGRRNPINFQVPLLASQEARANYRPQSLIPVQQSVPRPSVPKQQCQTEMDKWYYGPPAPPAQTTSVQEPLPQNNWTQFLTGSARDRPGEWSSMVRSSALPTTQVDELNPLFEDIPPVGTDDQIEENADRDLEGSVFGSCNIGEMNLSATSKQNYLQGTADPPANLKICGIDPPTKAMMLLPASMVKDVAAAVGYDINFKSTFGLDCSKQCYNRAGRKIAFYEELGHRCGKMFWQMCSLIFDQEKYNYLRPLFEKNWGACLKSSGPTKHPYEFNGDFRHILIRGSYEWALAYHCPAYKKGTQGWRKEFIMAFKKKVGGYISLEKFRDKNKR